MKARGVLVVLLALVMLCSFAGCQKEPVPSAESMEWIWVSEYGSQGALSQTGYYYTDGPLCYADFAAGANTTLCYVADCAHKRNCDAIITASTDSMQFWQDRLYFIRLDFSGMSLYSRNNIGTGELKVCSLGSKYMEESAALRIEGNCAIVNGFYYYCGAVTESVPDGNGGTTTKENRAFIGCVNLKTGKEEIIFEEEYDKNLENLMICAVREDGVLFAHREGTEVNRDDPDYVKKTRQMPMTLMQWSRGTGETTVIFSKPYLECSSIKCVTGGKVYYLALRTEENNMDYHYYSYNLDTGKEEFVGEGARWFMGGGYSAQMDRETGKYRLVNLLTGEELPNNINLAGALRCKSDLGFVITKSIFEDPNATTGSVSALEYYYIAYESLADGAQESDLVYLYTDQMGGS